MPVRRKTAPKKKTPTPKIAAKVAKAPTGRPRGRPRKIREPVVSDIRPVLFGGPNFLGMSAQHLPHGMAYLVPDMAAARLELLAPGGASAFGVSAEARVVFVVSGIATIRDSSGNLNAISAGQGVVAGPYVPIGYEAGREPATVLIVETAPVRVLEAPRAVNEAEVDQVHQAALTPPEPISRKPMPPPFSTKARNAAIAKANRRAMRAPHRMAMPANIAGEVAPGAAPLLPDGTPAGRSFHGSQQATDNAPLTLRENVE